jgi:hypothetical protein
MSRVVAQVCATLSVLGVYWALIYLGAGTPLSVVVAVMMIVAIYYIFRRKPDD